MQTDRYLYVVLRAVFPIHIAEFDEFLVMRTERARRCQNKIWEAQHER